MPQTESNPVAGLLTGVGAIIVGLVLSLVIVPTAVYYLLVVRAAATTGASTVLVVGTLAMVPGFLMGGLGLWTAARG